MTKEPDRTPPTLAHVTVSLRDAGALGPYAFTDWDERSRFIHTLAEPGLKEAGRYGDDTPLHVVDGEQFHILLLSYGPVACIETRRTPEGEAVYQENLRRTRSGTEQA